MQTKFQASEYGPKVAPLLDVATVMEIGPGRPNPAHADLLKSISVEELFPNRSIEKRDMAELCLSGLLLLHGYLHESHEISQGHGSAEGSYWHGLMHRREPDFSNAKYWFARVGTHPVMDALAEEVPSMLKPTDLDFSTAFLAQQSEWQADKFVDLCEAVLLGRSEGEQICRSVVVREWEMLFDYCYRKAVAA